MEREMQERDVKIKNMIQSNLVEHANKVLDFTSIEQLTSKILTCVIDVLTFNQKKETK